MSSDKNDPTGEIAAEIADREFLRKKQALAGLVVHDLRNPLAALAGNLEIIREDLQGVAVAESVNEALEDCSVLVAKALALVASILDVEELEEGVLKAHPSEVELEALLQRAATLNRPAIRVRGLQFMIEVTPGMHGFLDRELTFRVLENLLDNAVRYAPRGGKVMAWARAEGELLELAVGNNGPPVSEADRQAIFGRYFRIEARRAGARAGRGLGLYFCKLAIEAQGGTLAVEQRGELGAVFVVRLPRQARPAASP